MQEEVERRGDPGELSRLREQVGTLRALVDAHMEAEGEAEEDLQAESIGPAHIHSILQVLLWLLKSFCVVVALTQKKDSDN